MKGATMGEEREKDKIWLSHSQIGMFQRCPAQYEKRYIEGMKKPPPFSMFLGFVGHDTLDHNNKQKIDSGIDLLFKEVAEFYNKVIDLEENQTFWALIRRAFRQLGKRSGENK